MNRESLIENLQAAGKSIEAWESVDGSRVLVLPYGGRVLGLFAPGNDANFFWTHAALADRSMADSFYGSDVWHNSGGDRTWLAPEVDFFFPDYPDLGRYWQQRELDPGCYAVARYDGFLRWSTRAELTLSRTRQRIDLEVTKTLGPALNPLRYDQRDEWRNLDYAGYTLTTTLQLRGDEIPPQVGLWQLLQLPHGGEMLVATASRSEPKVLMGTIAADDLTVETQLTRYRMHAAGEYKLGLRASSLAGRAGYLWGSGNGASLVIRNFAVNPSGEYVDVPWLEPENFGFAFQACNVNSHLGAFSELEYHVPAIGSKSGKLFSADESQVWAFRGPEAAVRSVAQHLLSPDV